MRAYGAGVRPPLATSFAEYALGEPAEWPQGHGSFAADVTAEAGAFSGKKLYMTSITSTGTRRWARVPTGLTDLEVMAVSQLPSTDPLPNVTSYCRTAIRMNAAGTVYYLLSWDKANARLKMEIGSLPSSDAILAVAAHAGFSPGGIVAIRFQAIGTALKGKMWTYGDSEPGWQIETTDATIANGGAGYRKTRIEAQDAYWWYAVGVGGLTAPSPP